MRCPACDTTNDDGAAICVACGAPLTPYAATVVTDSDPARTAAKLAELEERPPLTSVVAVADLAAAVVAIITVIRAFAATPELSADATNYMGRTFGGLRAALTAGVMLPMGLGLVMMAWGAATQKAWAWSIHLAAFGLIALVAVVTLRANPILSVVELGIVGAAAWQWLQPRVRRWYGHE